MSWASRWRADMRRPEVLVRREERPFLASSALLVVVVAQWNDPGGAIELVGLSPAIGAFWLRGWVRRLPAEVFAVLVVVPVGLVVGFSRQLELMFFLVVIMVLYTSWHLGSTIRAAVILVVSAATPLVVSVVEGDNEINWMAWSSAVVFLFILGRNLRSQRMLIEELEAAREALADTAVAAERQRIARELHDLAGHTLAAVLLHVTGARHVLRRDLADAEQALVEAETVGRASLDQIRAAVAVLRTSERGTDSALAGPADLALLVDEYRRAGLVIDTRSSETLDFVEGPMATALHRIVRESLSNVARHAATNRVELSISVVGRVDGRPADACVVVADFGRRAAEPDPGGLHFGIVGMHERVRAFGGEMFAGPTADGWRVEARLPLQPTNDSAAT